MDKFEVGDVVSLKSGGPDMTVRDVNEDDTAVITIWFDKNYQLCEKAFWVEELEMGPRLV